MKLYDSMGDGLRINYAENVLVSNCEMYNLQHSSIFLIDVIGAEIYDNDIKHITCAGVRLDNCQDVVIRDSLISDWTGTTSAWAGGSNGIQIGAQPATYGHTTLSQNIEVYNCDIQGGGCGICLMDAYQTVGTTAQTVYIHNNEIHDSGDGNAAAYFSGISVWSWGNGLNIQYNNIADNFNAGILIYGCFQSGSTAYVANNNILDTVQAGTTGGYGIRNLVNTKMTVQAVNNYLSGNILGKYYQVTPTSEASSSILTAGIIEETVIVPDDPDDPVTPPTNTTPSTDTAIGDRVLLLPIQGGGYVLLKIVTNAR